MTARRHPALLARLFLGAAVLAGAGCSHGGSDEASTTMTTTFRSAVTATTAAPTTTTAQAAAASSETSTTTSTAAPPRRPAPTTSSSATAPAPRAPAPKASTTTATRWEVPAENLVPGPGPQFSTWAPPSDLAPGSVHNVWTPAPGVEMTPPYQAPTPVGSVEYVGCVRHNDTNLWQVTVRATLTGGRYWRFPGSANGNTGTFQTIHQSMVGLEFDQDGFDGTISYVTVEVGDGKREDVPVSPPLKFHCAP